MRNCAWLLLTVAGSAGVLGCRSQIGDEPLLLEAPLLLEEPDETESLPPPKGPVADNSRCHVCHLNLEDEKLAVIHSRANVGCEKCHGECDAHCGDEDNITPPDIMYPRDKINPSCMKCHPELSDEHEEIVKGTATKNECCTDCHGEHRLGYRTRRWDKATGELMEDDSVRMMSDDALKKE